MTKLSKKFLLYFFCLNLVFLTGQSTTDDNNTNAIIYLSGSIISGLGGMVLYNNIDSKMGKEVCFSLCLLSFVYCTYQSLKSINNSEETE